MKVRVSRFLTALLVVGTAACSSISSEKKEMADTYAPIVPAYNDSIVIPVNIAPLNFAFLPDFSDMKRAEVRIQAYDSFQNPKDAFTFKIKRVGGTKMAERKWKKLLAQAVKGSLQLDICVETEDKVIGYRPLHWFVSADTIDKYLLYRVSQYEEGQHGEVFLVQRDLENFKTTLLGHNRLLDYDAGVRSQRSCMNCHDCWQNNSHNMVFHIRGTHKGTILMRGDTLLKIAVPDNYNIRLTYPSWHPSGKIVAFSTNTPISVHYASATQKIIYTLDTLGDIVFLDVEKMQLFSCPQLTDSTFEDVFPTWSPDGKKLYFCRSPQRKYEIFPFPQYIDSSLSMHQNRNEQIWDDLMQMDFDLTSRRFSNLRCVYPFSQMQKSATMPKVSKDGHFLILSLLATSSFPIQNLGDFYQLDLQADTMRPTELKMLNTSGSEKGHSFSSSGRWMVFSSSRRTLVIPETHITHFDTENGMFSKPFLVPQKQGDFYLTNLQGFVFPVLSTVPARYEAKETMNTARTKASLVKIDSSLSRFKLKDGQKAIIRGGH